MRAHNTPIPVGPHILWPLNAGEVDIELGDIGGDMGDQLACIDGTQRSRGVSGGSDTCNGDQGTGDISHCRNRYELGTLEELIEIGQVKQSVRTNLEPPKFDASFGRQHVPRHNVCMMFEDTEHHHIAPLQVGAAPRGGDQVQRFGGVLGEDDFVGAASSDQACDFFAGAFHGSGCLVAQEVRTTMHVRIGVFVEVAHCIEYLGRLLRSTRRIEVHEFSAVDWPVQDREVSLDFGYIDGRSLDGCGVHRKASYPSDSSCWASSMPPLATILPSTSTCTWSG